MSSNVQLVRTAQIKMLKFPKEDVFSNKNDKISRFVKLHKALYLENSRKDKIKIVFSDDTSLKSIETTLKGITKNKVVLKNAIEIPLARIISVAS